MRLVLLTPFVAAAGALAQGVDRAAAPPPPPPDLAAAVRELASHPALAGSRVGVHVRDLADGRVLAQHDDDKGFMTASNMKLLASATALLTLGPDFRFVTRLEAHGPIHDGLLDGDLVLVGAGDPTLGGRHEKDGPRAPLLRMARRLRDEFGVDEISGNVLGDDDCQPDEVMGEGWSWGYESADYAAQVSGLCFAENVVRLTLTARADGQRPALRLEPETGYLTLIDRVVVGGDKTGIDIARRRGGNQATLQGRLASGAKHADAVSVDNPTSFAAHVLSECLREVGIRVRGVAADKDDLPVAIAAGRSLCEESSPLLRDVLRTLNKVSQNLYAEQLVRAAGRAARGTGGMVEAAATAADVLRELGGDPTGLVMADGSGLTRLDLVQPRQLADLLAGMWRHPHREVFVATLPVAGVDGTLGKRMQDGPAHGHVRAKTGFISRVVALSGYVDRPDPKVPPLVFSILLNNFTCDTQAAKDAVDALVQELARAAGW
ncbi:MAG: D-alanyl-D-alanine carboxypeptidase/D-alanyl-D-alanine-endopeptidase [Planctomycetota bacterium]